MNDAASKTYDLFASYNRRDQDQVRRVAEALRERGLGVFLDTWYLTPGRPWPDALERALSATRATAVFVGPHGFGSWQQREQWLALDRQAREQSFLVIPVLLPGSEPPLGFLGLNTWVDLRNDIDDGAMLDILAAAARGGAVAVQAALSARREGEPAKGRDEGQVARAVSSDRQQPPVYFERLPRRPSFGGGRSPRSGALWECRHNMVWLSPAWRRSRLRGVERGGSG